MSNIQPNLIDLPKLAAEKHSESVIFFKRLKRRTPKNLDLLMQDLHDTEFETTDCLDCGNCCKTTSPLFTDRDINRLSRFLKIKELDFITTYLERDADDFMVLKTAPCPFLDLSDNHCLVYDARPRACQEYPHTNRRKFIQIVDLTLNNTSVCPAVYNIIEALKKKV
jgi:Fe-S-cluster containining protein